MSDDLAQASNLHTSFFIRTESVPFLKFKHGDLVIRPRGVFGYDDTHCICYVQAVKEPASPTNGPLYDLFHKFVPAIEDPDYIHGKVRVIRDVHARDLIPYTPDTMLPHVRDEWHRHESEFDWSYKLP